MTMNRPFQLIDEADAAKMWEEWNVPFKWDEATIEWLRNRPPSIIELLLKFPPDAKVIATRPLDCPKPNEIGIMSSWFEDGSITVTVPGRPIKAACQPSWIKVIAYRKGFTPDDIWRNIWGNQ